MAASDTSNSSKSSKSSGLLPPFNGPCETCGVDAEIFWPLDEAYPAHSNWNAIKGSYRSMKPVLIYRIQERKRLHDERERKRGEDAERRRRSVRAAAGQPARRLVNHLTAIHRALALARALAVHREVCIELEIEPKGEEIREKPSEAEPKSEDIKEKSLEETELKSERTKDKLFKEAIWHAGQENEPPVRPYRREL